MLLLFTDSGLISRYLISLTLLHLHPEPSFNTHHLVLSIELKVIAMTTPESPDKTTITILLLGDPGCGKSTFLSWVPNQPKRKVLDDSRTEQANQLLSQHSSLKTPLVRPLPSHSNNPPPASITKPEILRDTGQPFLYDIRFSRKSFTLEFFDTASPNQHWTTLRPDVVVLAFDISERGGLEGLRGVSISLLS